jgi:hypothetical protein
VVLGVVTPCEGFPLRGRFVIDGITEMSFHIIALLEKKNILGRGGAFKRKNYREAAQRDVQKEDFTHAARERTEVHFNKSDIGQ